MSVWRATVFSIGLIAASQASASGLRDVAERMGFEIGVAIGPDEVARHGPLIAREFTSITTENTLKWGALSPRPEFYDFTAADAVVRFAEAQGMRVRGHTLIWTRLNGPPRWLTSVLAETNDPGPVLQALSLAHISTVVERYAGRVAQWDVVNEPLVKAGTGLDSENPFLSLLGEDFLVQAFSTAANADPTAELFMNEVFTEHSDGRFEALVALVERLRARGAPIHGVGLQGHFLYRPPDPDGLRRRFERLALLGLKVEITELDIHLGVFRDKPDALGAQAVAYASVLDACLAVPACSGVTVWGLGDNDSWLGADAAPLLFDQDYQQKPAYDAVLQSLSAATR